MLNASGLSFDDSFGSTCLINMRSSKPFLEQILFFSLLIFIWVLEWKELGYIILHSRLLIKNTDTNLGLAVLDTSESFSSRTLTDDSNPIVHCLIERRNLIMKYVFFSV